MEYFARFPLPPFSPRGHVIQGGTWLDRGEWEDDGPAFPDVPQTLESYLASQTGAALNTQDDDIINL